MLAKFSNLNSIDNDEAQWLISLLQSRISTNKQDRSAGYDQFVEPAAKIVKRIKLTGESHDLNVGEYAQAVSKEEQCIITTQTRSQTAPFVTSWDTTDGRSVDVLSTFESLITKLDGDGLKKIGRLIQRRILRTKPFRGPITAKRLQQVVDSMESSQRTELQNLLQQFEHHSSETYSYNDLKTFVHGSLPSNAELSREFSERISNFLGSTAPQHCTAETIMKLVLEFKRNDPDEFQLFLDHDFCKYVQKHTEFLETSGNDLEEIKVISPQGRHLKARAQHSGNSNISRVFGHHEKDDK